MADPAEIMATRMIEARINEIECLRGRKMSASERAKLVATALVRGPFGNQYLDTAQARLDALTAAGFTIVPAAELAALRAEVARLRGAITDITSLSTVKPRGSDFWRAQRADEIARAALAEPGSGGADG